MSADPQKGKTMYNATNMEPHESLTLETKENGTVGVKFYSYQPAINPAAFATKLKLIKEELKKINIEIEGMTDKLNVKTEISNDNSKGEKHVTVKGDSVKSAKDAYNEVA